MSYSAEMLRANRAAKRADDERIARAAGMPVETLYRCRNARGRMLIPAAAAALRAAWPGYFARANEVDPW